MLIGQASGKLPETSNVALALLPPDTRFNPGATPYQHFRPLSQRRRETMPESYNHRSYVQGSFFLGKETGASSAYSRGSSPNIGEYDLGDLKQSLL